MSRAAPDPRDVPLRGLIGTMARALASAKEIDTVGGLLDFLPRSYLDPTRPTDFATLVDGEYVVLLAVVRHAVTRPMRQRRGSLLVVTVTDEEGHQLDLTFFGRYGHAEALRPGVRVVCSGTVTSFNARRQLTHPEYQVVTGTGTDVDAGGVAGYAEGPIPIYSQVKGLTSMKISAAIDLVLHAVPQLPDPVPEAVRRRHRLPPLREAYRMVHQPREDKEQRLGRWRLKWQEAFVIQAALAQRRHTSQGAAAIPRTYRPDGLAAQFRERLPFQLTQGQETVLAQLQDDLARQVPMHRLLQGEVGSGKTVVALLAMLTVVDGGGQAALLAPTEVLALQHHRSIRALLGPLAEGGLLGGAEGGTRVALLTGSQSSAERRQMLLQAASGEAGLVVGTHALIQEHVQFTDLGLVVVDEQHRFGVEQRDALRGKARMSPHMLVMTATPIPRSVAMTVFGDMETSTLRELPVGRAPITTHVVSGDRPGWAERTWQRVGEEVRSGGQVYVVCPRIGAPDDPDLPEGTTPGVPLPSEPDEPAPLHGVHQVFRALGELPALAGLRVEAMHGRQGAEDKEAVMSAFVAGQVDVLVATTVIEVGVDVPNATAMVVLDADRFGISQLHQLRGRVGRGGKPGLCLLVSQHADGPSLERLNAVAGTVDGFELARLDLELRREGDVLGAVQSGGRSTLRFLRLARDEELIVAAHEAAWAVVQDDPQLADHVALRAELARLDAERAAFLERG